MTSKLLLSRTCDPQPNHARSHDLPHVVDALSGSVTTCVRVISGPERITLFSEEKLY